MRILGISPQHDASVCVVDDGKIIYFSKQERQTRIKRDELKKQNIKVLNYVLENYQDKEIENIIICSSTPGSVFVEWLQMYLWPKLKNISGCRIHKFCSNHHLTHASLAFYNSGFKKALSIVIDRNGSLIEKRMRESESVFISEYPCEFKTIYKNYFLIGKGEEHDVENHKLLSRLKKEFKGCEMKADSTMNITKVYETATTLIGQSILENDKTMDLAAYGKDKPFEKLFRDHLPNDDLFFHHEDAEVGKKEYRDLQTTKVPKNNTIYADYAFQVQKQTQEEVLHLVKKHVEKTRIKNVCLTGGYMLNAVTTGFLVKNLPEVNFYFEPLADDSGKSIGVALGMYRFLTKDKTIHKLKHVFFNHKKDKIKNRGKKGSILKIVKCLTDQKIVAVYYDQAEAGPRALGHRSLLFDARNKRAKDIINKVKKREWYRPFACSVLKKYAKDYFDMYHLEESPFMTISFPVLKDKIKIIPGVVHVDHSCRVQTVDESIPHLYKLLTEFYKKTKVPVLLNTSFNMAGEPLVESYEDAIKAFEETDIDVLWFPEKDRIIEK